MNPSDKHLLENLFDSLDRLFDCESTVIDVYHLIFATEKAIASDPMSPPLSGYTNKLEEIVRSGEVEEIRRQEALVVTDKLRNSLNELLSC